MGIRESIEKNQGVTIAVVVVVIAVAVFISVRSTMTAPPTRPTKAFFTADDGKTWFASGMENLPPFDYQGKTAYRLVVLTCDNGKTKFGGYLERYTPEAKKKLQAMEDEAIKAGKSPALIQFGSPDIQFGGTEIKKPGDGNPWINKGDHARAGKIMNYDCPNGGPVDSVLPD